MDGGKSIVNVALDASHAGMRLDKAIAMASEAAGLDLSRERIKALIATGAIVDAQGRALTQGSAKVAGLTTLSITMPDLRDAVAQAQDIAIPIVYEDDALIVVDKPAGLVVHPAAGNPDGTLVNALLHHCRGRLSGIGGVARPGIVHRIDKDTSGLLVVAKTDAAHQHLARQFFDHSIERVYHCIVNGIPAPASGTIDAHLARSPHNRQKIAVTDGTSGKRAVTHFLTKLPLRSAALVECRLETGRTHQVRVHMAHIGHSLVGDHVYGRSHLHQGLLDAIGFRRQALHAAHLGFIHPVSGKAVSFDSVMPPDMQTLFTRLKLTPENG